MRTSPTSQTESQNGQNHGAQNKEDPQVLGEHVGDRRPGLLRDGGEGLRGRDGNNLTSRVRRSRRRSREHGRGHIRHKLAGHCAKNRELRVTHHIPSLSRIGSENCKTWKDCCFDNWIEYCGQYLDRYRDYSFGCVGGCRHGLNAGELLERYVLCRLSSSR